MDNKEQAVENYMQAYKRYQTTSIENEESAIVLKQRAREALDLGIPLQTLREARRQIDDRAEFNTDWK
jgi:hypothetical protein